MSKISDASILQMAGAIVMVVGVWIFLKDQRIGETSGGFGPFNFKVTTPSLSFFLVGAAIFIFPFTDYFRDNSNSKLDDHVDTTASKSIEDLKDADQPTEMPTPGAPAWLVKLRHKKEDIYLRLCDVDNKKMFDFESWLGEQVGIAKVNVQKDTPGDTYTTWSYIDWGGVDKDIGNGLSNFIRERYGLDVPALPKARDTTGSMITIDIAGAKCVDTSRPPGTPAPVKVIG